MKKIILTVCCLCALSGFSQDQRRRLVDSLLAGIRIQKDIRYNLEGRPLLLDIYHPGAQTDNPLPCVVWIHGGALTDTSLKKDYDLVRWGVARTVMKGYVGVSIDYRLITEKPLPAAIQDCETAVRFLKSNASKYGIDADRMAVVGESAGGYLAGFCTFASDTNAFTTGEWNGVSNKIKCGVLWYPAIEHPPYSVLDYISPGDIPVLSVHGGRDHIVPIEKSYQIRRKCSEKGVDFQLRTIEGAGHGFFDETNWKFDETYRRNMETAINVTLSFLDRNCKGVAGTN
jgi:acetyl esterase/lipase